jgi:non-ribosomal peptide synthetase component F
MPRAFVGKNKSLLHFIDWEIEAFGIAETFRFSQWVTPGFDAFLRDVFTPLCAGAVICIPPRKVLEMAGPDLVHWLNARHICLIHCVPSIFRLSYFIEKTLPRKF